MHDHTLAAAMREYYVRRAPEYDDWYIRLGRYDDRLTHRQWHAGLRERDRGVAALAWKLAAGGLARAVEYEAVRTR